MHAKEPEQVGSEQSRLAHGMPVLLDEELVVVDPPPMPVEVDVVVVVVVSPVLVEVAVDGPVLVDVMDPVVAVVLVLEALPPVPLGRS
jgi:hypothetical protein